MEQINTKVKKWGNSFGIVVPMEMVNKEKMKEGTELVVSVRIKRSMTVGDLMEFGRKIGVDKRLKGIDTQRAMREVDVAFWPEGE